jgi:hypothetical protein
MPIDDTDFADETQALSGQSGEQQLPFHRTHRGQITMISAAILALGVTVGGYLLGDGLRRSREADRAVTVRGVAEKEVTADLATWTIAYSATAPDLASAQSSVDRNSQDIRDFFGGLGFAPDALQPTGVNVSISTDNGLTRFTVRQRMALRTTDIRRAQDAVRRQFDLVRRGVLLEEGSGMAYTYTKLNAIKPPMIAEATRDARRSAEQFAKDSGTGVGGIKSATQGYFEVTARDGDSGGGWGVSDTPFKKVRVVTTIEFYLR